MSDFRVHQRDRFHSISFPSEWGVNGQHAEPELWFDGFHSISFPSEWGGHLRQLQALPRVVCFHSISFPSEWGAVVIIFLVLGQDCEVSIQLVSPASGERSRDGAAACGGIVFPFN